MQYAMFLRWWLLAVLITLGTVICYYFGILQEIWQKDSSYLSLATMALFYFMTCWCGFKSWNLTKESNALTTEDVFKYKSLSEIGWFTSELCLTLGMAGTIIGFIMMLSGFENLNVAEAQTIQQLLAQLGKSMATALYTTIVGLICGSLLKIQYFNLGLELEKYSEINEEL